MKNELRCEDMDGETSRMAHLPNITPQQLAALIQLYHRGPCGVFTLHEFVGSAWESRLDDCIFVPWCNMVIGIEKDGYSHT
jgi:hypothetical protein